MSNAIKCPFGSDQITRYPPKKDMKPILKVSSRRCCCCCCIASDDRGGPCTLVLPRSRVGDEFAASPPSDCALHTTVVARSNRNNTRRWFMVGCRIVMVDGGLGWLLLDLLLVLLASKTSTRSCPRYSFPRMGQRGRSNFWMSVAILLTPNLCDRRDVRANRIYVDTNFKYHKTRQVPATRSARHFFSEIAGVPFTNSTSQ